MKKILFLIIIFFISSFIVLGKEDSSKDNFKDTLRYDYIYIKIDNLTLDNLKEKIKDVEIIAVDLYINPVYEDNLLLKYTTKNNIKEKYLKYLKEHDMYNEYNKFLVSPIRINRVLVYSNLSSLKKLNLL